MTALKGTSQSGNKQTATISKAMILAAGLGTRLRPLTEETPKALIIVGGRPLIHYQIALLHHYGVREIAINLHHLGALIEKELGDGRRWDVAITYSHEEAILGTGGGIRKLTPFFGNKEFWVLNSDILIDADLAAIAQTHRKNRALATMVLRPHPAVTGEAMHPTAFHINEAGRIIRTIEGVSRERRVAPEGGLPPRGLRSTAGHLPASGPGALQETPLMFTGLHLMHPDLLQFLPEGRSCIFRDAYQPALAQQRPIFGYTYDGYWKDLGTMESYQQADRDLRTGRVQLSYR